MKHRHPESPSPEPNRAQSVTPTDKTGKPCPPPARVSSASEYPTVSRARRVADIICIVLLLIAIAAEMAMIYALSAESIAESQQTSGGFIDKLASIIFYDYDDLTFSERMEVRRLMSTPIRKLAHFSEYALLGCLTGGLALTACRRKRWPTWVLPAAFCLIYAASDEIHQIFSARGPSVLDVLIDFVGSLVGLCAAHLLVFLIRRILDGGRKKGKGTRRASSAARGGSV